MEFFEFDVKKFRKSFSDIFSPKVNSVCTQNSWKIVVHVINKKFIPANFSQQQNSSSSIPLCYKYAVIRDRKSGQSLTICGRMGDRESNVYTSMHNEIQIEVALQRNAYFLIKYEGKL